MFMVLVDVGLFIIKELLLLNIMNMLMLNILLLCNVDDIGGFVLCVYYGLGGYG